MTDFAKIYRVELVPYVGTMDTETGPVEIEHQQYCVRVHSDLIKNDRHMYEVGYIGKQKDARFLPVGAFGNFHGPQRDWIAAEVVKLHGKALPGYMDVLSK